MGGDLFYYVALGILAFHQHKELGVLFTLSMKWPLVRVLGSTLPFALVRDAKIDRILGDSMGI